MTPHRTKEQVMNSFLTKLLKNMSPVEARCISQGDRTIAPWLVSKVFDNLSDSQAEAVALDLEALVSTWGASTTDEARKSLRGALGL
jgi:hypothetical protein